MKFPWRGTRGPIARVDPGATIARALHAAGLQSTPGVAAVPAGVRRRARAPSSPEADPRVRRGRSVHQGLGRSVRVFVPASVAGSPRALVLMLHGCTQDAHDFAVGTRMDERAAARGWIVAYPEQDARANGARCWNWFQPGDQQAEAGEPGFLAALARDLAAANGVDPRHIHVAGLSAGGAMAAILAREHPEIFASVGIHSGLPAGAAHDVPSAFAAMKHGASSAGRPGPPVIVFHGDADATVAPRNGELLVAAQGGAASTRHQGHEGRDFVRAVHRGADGRVVAEHWLLHGAQHAWSGGSSEGSWTDPLGPDASSQMLRFFGEQPLSV